MRYPVAPRARRRQLGIDKFSKAGLPARYDAGVDEGFKELLEFWRPGREELGAVIEAVFTDTPRRHATADAARLLEDRYLVTGREFASDDESGQSGSDDGDLGHGDAALAGSVEQSSTWWPRRPQSHCGNRREGTLIHSA